MKLNLAATNIITIPRTSKTTPIDKSLPKPDNFHSKSLANHDTLVATHLFWQSYELGKADLFGRIVIPKKKKTYFERGIHSLAWLCIPSSKIINRRANALWDVQIVLSFFLYQNNCARQSMISSRNSSVSSSEAWAIIRHVSLDKKLCRSSIVMSFAGLIRYAACMSIKKAPSSSSSSFSCCVKRHEKSNHHHHHHGRFSSVEGGGLHVAPSVRLLAQEFAHLAIPFHSNFFYFFLSLGP